MTGQDEVSACDRQDLTILYSKYWTTAKSKLCVNHMACGNTACPRSGQWSWSPYSDAIHCLSPDICYCSSQMIRNTIKCMCDGHNGWILRITYATYTTWSVDRVSNHQQAKDLGIHNGTITLSHALLDVIKTHLVSSRYTDIRDHQPDRVLVQVQPDEERRNDINNNRSDRSWGLAEVEAYIWSQSPPMIKLCPKRTCP